MTKLYIYNSKKNPNKVDKNKILKEKRDRQSFYYYDEDEIDNFPPLPQRIEGRGGLSIANKTVA